MVDLYAFMVAVLVGVCCFALVTSAIVRHLSTVLFAVAESAQKMQESTQRRNLFTSDLVWFGLAGTVSLD